MKAIKHRKTFEAVLDNSDDQAIVRRILKRVLPFHIKDQVVEQFNQHVDNYNDKVAEMQRSTGQEAK
ncbi:MAG: hypothetical protein KAJ10_03700 [Thermodesulfovibrionia bacterium]|nr:hypothetical protein [Thermodesulfovibrionia bacterium]